MTSILVVCTGNICRSPIAEGMLRDALSARFGGDAPDGVLGGHVGRRGVGRDARSGHRGGGAGRRHRRAPRPPARDRSPADADLVIAMAGEHRDVLGDEHRRWASGRFTLKELVRLLESLPPVPPGAGPDSLSERVDQARAARRAGFAGNPLDEDVADPIGMPLQSYRAIAWELDEWIARLVDGLYGAVPVPAASEG